MSDREQNQPASTAQAQNPYLPPSEAGLVGRSIVLPPMHWPRTIVMFVVFFVAGFATYGTTLPLAFAILFGGLRTALIYRGCAKTNRIPPGYLGSTILSPILCIVFQIAAGTAFFFICASRFAMDRPALSEQAWLSMTGIIALGVFAALYVLSINIAVANCRPNP